MVEALRVLKVCRKSAIAARRVALQMIQGTIVSAPDALHRFRSGLLRAILAIKETEYGSYT